ncbi:MAG: 50S ribosomal protein L19 [Candidatus Pacebacteria bacterium CG10_big_fil_rev_8_21_14_0_10_42_12]|nr:MAG: 50S ribosomal protein L19 [Candidatus Pacebacteria bacterium CG10_big_fil_rev_8_21_14_0_10_42_12]
MSQFFTILDQKVSVGDTVRVHEEISEGNKNRIQIFEGIVIASKNRDNGKSFIVRKVSGGLGVEKIFPVNVPAIKKIEIKSKGSVRRSKLYYLRARIGKAASRIKEKKFFNKAA